MGEHYSELSRLLGRVRPRWRAVAALRAWSLAAAAASLVLALALVAQRIVVPDGFAMVGLWLIAAAVALASGMMAIRILALVGVLNARMVPRLAFPLLAMAAAAGIIALLLQRGSERAASEDSTELRNPFSLKAALF